MSQRSIVFPHDQKWIEMFKQESERLRTCLPLVHIRHIGSTAIPGIYAKPIIDMLGEADDLRSVEVNTPRLVELGYEAMGEFGIPGRRYFRKDVDGERKFHLHVFETDSEEAKRHLRFRDYLKAHPKQAREYSGLKLKLVRECEGNIDRYMDGKDPFIREIDKLAARFYGER
ncbi:MAG: GrpB family protein [Pyrinomonadaceae bacterium]|nr:GrpB family protein [Pyrinomonadaceae bacterium]